MIASDKNKEKIFNYSLCFILLSSFLIRIFYVFYCTDYKNYIFSDMSAYWDKAIARYNGDIFPMSQWTAWAPFYYFYLTFVFKILFLLGQFEHKLEAVLLLNIIFSTASVLFVYLISKHLLKNKLFSLLVSFFYAFSYPLIYFNAFVLTENFFIPILIFSVYLLFEYHENKPLMFINGLVFALAVSARPSMGLLVIPFLLYIIYANKPSTVSCLTASLFILGFSIIIFSVTTEINYISKGQTKSLYPSSGAIFFIYQCKHSLIESNNGGYIFGIGPPLNYTHPEWGIYKTNHALHEQGYFYNLGFECLKKNPNLLEKITNIKALFINSLFPSLGSANNFPLFIKISNHLILFMTFSLGLLYYLFKYNLTDFKKTLFLLSIPFSVVLMSFFYPPEQRYLFPAFFIIYLLFFVSIFKIHFYKKEALNYFRILAIGYFICLFLG